MDDRLRRYNDDLIDRLVRKYDSQQNGGGRGGGGDGGDFFDTNYTQQILMEGNSAIITLWDSAVEEVSEVLLGSCAVHSFVDEYMQINYG